MTSLKYLLLPVSLAAFSLSCSPPAPVHQAEQKPVEESSAFRVYVTNEVSGDMTIIDSGTYKVIATVPLGKRPRGIHASPDRKTIYVALSGSPIGGPDVDESTLPPPDKTRMESAYSTLHRKRSCARLRAVPIRRTSTSAKMELNCSSRTKTTRP